MKQRPGRRIFKKTTYSLFRLNLQSVWPDLEIFENSLCQCFFKISPNVWWLFRLYENITFLVKTALATIRKLLENFGLLLISTPDHTVCNAQAFDQQLLHDPSSPSSCSKEWPLRCHSHIANDRSFACLTSVTRKKSPNVYKSCTKMKNDRFWHLYKKCLRMWKI